MVSTYFSYSYITRNLKQSLTRVEQQQDVAREAAYYKAHIGKVKSVDDFMKDYRLYRYATKAYGLEDMAYAKAFMKKVLESDLSDANSFINKLVDKRYREFAAAFSFNGSATSVAQSENQTDEMIGLYTATRKSQVDALAGDSNYYSAEIGNISSADQLLNNDRLRNYVYSAYGIDQSKWSRDTISQVLRSDPSDPNSYVNTTFASQLSGLNADLAQARSDVTAANSRIADYTAQLSQPGANVAQLNVQILVEKHHLESYASSIFSLSEQIGTIGGFVDLAGAFEFSSDGSLPSGVSAQTAANVTITKQKFDDSKSAVYSAASPLNEAFAIRQFRTAILKINSVQAFVSTPGVYEFALGAVGLEPVNVSPATVKAVLESDINDPKSYVCTLKDNRYLELARAFNFDAKGNLTTPLVAQDSAEVLQIAKDYVIGAVKSASTATPQQQAAVRAQATKDASEYQQAIAGIDSVSDLLANRPMVDFILLAKGLDPRKVSTEFLKKIFSSDLNDPKSFANTESDPRFAEIVASFNFDSKGNVARLPMMGPQKRDQFRETQANYVEQSLEQQQGDANPGVRLALYFQRKAGDITSAYDILADKALSEVFRTTFDLPDSMAAMPIDQQAKFVDRFMKIKDLSDPAKVTKLLSRFSAMYDIRNSQSTGQGQSPLLNLFQGSSSGISDSTYLAIAKLRTR
ncbi:MULTISPECIES: DUF1217 domain-containing protein [unclassified Bradyrhizobium]|uniref:DUF1217 domain-containing protein n=1 Tax=unclassified Bradyrhizobium TaxID=2631580 RepID=UPI001FFB2A23|nr:MULTISPECIES: DUF1217 domain-containing protein [unclassified Bradyrhizobium]MCK1343419.1 DUF1217 domain-containing protein [Bradyrhizobium sp. CW11]MCK1470220.1 DUF1217 domain-containing protein [Bradyrhizobium sp. CW10]MCK1485205.1 DUF1217 domain-containing protein [Bradyrhizobium sp. 193]MCK1536385.1 DUF1217 domain-containing protein [Bradyrhizobium sp. 176]MCK1556454.1 DUF1217 domain-containing protein [Bradyrhizobium sp. 171]